MQRKNFRNTESAVHGRGAESFEVRMKGKVHDWQEDVSDGLFCLAGKWTSRRRRGMMNETEKQTVNINKSLETAGTAEYVNLFFS